MPSIKNHILILFVHPAYHKSRINRKLISTVEKMEGLTIHNLYDEYPDYHINIKREQELLVKHDIIIWHHPFYWYSSPPLLKEWIDLVLQHNFAYGHKGTALKGKSVLSVITTGGRKEAYQMNGFNRYTIKQFLSPFEQTARLCSMHYLPPFVVDGTHIISPSELDRQVGLYRKAISYLAYELNINSLSGFEYFNDFIQLKNENHA